MKKYLTHLLIGLACAVPVALLTFTFAQAETAPPGSHPVDGDCQQCHAQY